MGDNSSSGGELAAVVGVLVPGFRPELRRSSDLKIGTCSNPAGRTLLAFLIKAENRLHQ